MRGFGGADTRGCYSKLRDERSQIDANFANEAFGLAANTAEPGDARLLGSRFAFLALHASSGSARKGRECPETQRAPLSRPWQAWHSSLRASPCAKCCMRKVSSWPLERQHAPL